MLDRFSRVLFTAVLLFMAVYLAWYGYCRKQVAAGNLEFQAESSFAEFFPQPLQLRGNLAYYGEMDPVMAAEYFREAIAVQPITIDAWLSLAQMELAMGRMDEARRLLGIVSPLIPHVSTWKWKQFALAGETRDEELFIHCYNFILSRLPARVGEASFLAATYWGGWDRVLPHVAPENHTVFLEQLMRYGQLDVALDLWRIIQEREAQSRLYVEQGAAGSVAQASSAGTNRPANPSSSGNAGSAARFLPTAGFPRPSGSGRALWTRKTRSTTADSNRNLSTWPSAGGLPGVRRYRFRGRRKCPWRVITLSSFDSTARRTWCSATCPRWCPWNPGSRTY